jgi:uncharacterized spore protein YtfJ
MDWSRLLEAVRRYLVVETLEGQPIHVGDKAIVPVARAISCRVGSVDRARGGPAAGGGGGGFVLVQPVAVLESTPAGMRRIPIRDVILQVVGGMALAALALPLALGILARLMSRHHQE